MLTRKIPAAALPVVEVIRNEVIKPRKLPKLVPTKLSTELSLRWGKSVRDDVGPFFRQCCPLGLIKDVESESPAYDYDLPLRLDLSERAVKSFGRWWDEQHDPQDAVDAVWGKDTP